MSDYDKLKVKELTDDELLRAYYDISDTSINSNNINQVLFIAPKTSVIATELQRRENKKTNRKIRNWTIAIGIMTAAMLIATVVNVIIAFYTNTQ